MTPKIRIFSNLNLRDGTNLIHDIDLHSYATSAPLVIRLLRLLKAVIIPSTYDVIFLNCAATDLLLVCAFKYLWPAKRPVIIAADLILHKPRTNLEWLKAYGRKVLLRKVGLFVFHQKDIAGYHRYYGIENRKVRYIPFKVNSLDQIKQLKVNEGDYVFTGGLSNRDYETLSESLKDITYPMIILAPGQRDAELKNHGTFLSPANFGPNVKIISDDGSSRSWIDYIAKSMFVVLPIRADAISPAGISTYLVAMALRKCVVITDSAATRGILNQTNCVTVPAGNSEALRDAIKRVYEDSALRAGVANAGYQYALTCGGTARLYENFLDCLREFSRTINVKGSASTTEAPRQGEL